MLLITIFCYLKLDFLSWISAWLDEDVEPGWTAERESRRMGNVRHYVSATQAHIKTKHLFAIAQFLPEHVKKFRHLLALNECCCCSYFLSQMKSLLNLFISPRDTFSYSFLRGCSIQEKLSYQAYTNEN